MIGLDTANSAITSARRASASDRRANLRFDVELRPLGGLSAIAEDWRGLSRRALEPNVFYEQAFALAAAPALGADVLAGLVWSRAPRALCGFFPVRVERRRYGFPFAILTGWTHPFAPIGIPLVDREMAQEAIAAWFDHVAGDPALPKLMLMPLLPVGGPLALSLAQVLARRRSAAATFDRHERALLAPGDNRAAYLQRSVSSKRRRNMRRRQRQLADHGALTTETARQGETLTRALEDYLALEAGGWKGRAGTAAVQNENIRDFMRRAIAALGEEDKVVIERLLVGGKPAASAIALKSGDRAWGWKVSYDESYAAYSPGVLAVAALTETLLADPAIAEADSCAQPSDSMAGQLWNERLIVADWLFSLEARGDFAFGLIARLEALRRAAIRAARAARDHLRRR